MIHCGFISVVQTDKMISCCAVKTPIVWQRANILLFSNIYFFFFNDFVNLVLR